MEYIKLNNGEQIPVLGIGTFMLSPDEAEASALTALKTGYSLIDTANAYLNEKAIGRAMKKSGIARKDIYLETKLWPAFYEDDKTIDKTLKRLNTKYIDLLLLHQPCGNYMHAYKLMENAVKAGKVKSIGLSNFEQDKIEEILNNCEIKPVLVQVEAHPYYQQEKLKKFLKKHDIKIQAWYPLGHGDPNLVNEPLFTELGKKYNKSNVAIILRWHIQAGNIVIPGGKNLEHIKQNINIFDFKLTKEEMKKIEKLDKNTRYYYSTPELLEKYVNMAPDLEAQK